MAIDMVSTMIKHPIDSLKIIVPTSQNNYPSPFPVSQLSQANNSAEGNAKIASKDRPVPTPCRAEDGSENVPELGDVTAEAPKQGEIRLSEIAINSRLKRLFQPNTKGEYRVPMEIVKQWQKKGKSRRSLEQVFQSCGFNSDRV